MYNQLGQLEQQMNYVRSTGLTAPQLWANVGGSTGLVAEQNNWSVCCMPLQLRSCPLAGPGDVVQS